MRLLWYLNRFGTKGRGFFRTSRQARGWWDNDGRIFITRNRIVRT